MIQHLLLLIASVFFVTRAEAMSIAVAYEHVRCRYDVALESGSKRDASSLALFIDTQGSEAFIDAFVEKARGSAVACPAYKVISISVGASQSVLRNAVLAEQLVREFSMESAVELHIGATSVSTPVKRSPKDDIPLTARVEFRHFEEADEWLSRVDEGIEPARRLPQPASLTPMENEPDLPPKPVDHRSLDALTRFELWRAAQRTRGL